MKEINNKLKILLIVMSSLFVVYIFSSSDTTLNSSSQSTSLVHPDIIVYKSATCGCCDDWIDHLEDNNFIVDTYNKDNMNLAKLQLGGVPRNLQSCHTAKVGDYLVEGHVHAELITKILKEKPSIKGLAVPGMPMGSPGMEGPRNDPYDVLAFNEDGSFTIYASYNQ
jgi:hypothetical protein|tara:strand:+ start:16 stop:516 length:501 start_codon:yes stop_codon:yes gene_type:complete